MKKTCIKSVAVILLICMMMTMLSACDLFGPKGKYTAKDSLIQQSVTFMDDNKIAVSAFGIDVEGEYVIKDGMITITYSLLGLSYDWTRSFSQKGDSVFIDGVEFVKEK